MSAPGNGGRLAVPPAARKIRLIKQKVGYIGCAEARTVRLDPCPTDRPPGSPFRSISPPMDPIVLLVFALVYLGMILGGLPGLALDRTGLALLGALLLVAAGKLTPVDAWAAVDVPTIALLFGLMVVSAQFRLGGFYTQLTRHLAEARVSPQNLLGLLILVAGGLSALLANDIVCLAMAPVLVEGCARRGLNPKPFLLGLACAANVGSAATLIGNPQNMLIGQSLRLSFAGYLLDGGIPALLGLGVVWWVLSRYGRGNWYLPTPLPELQTPDFDRWQTGKGLVVLALLTAAFLLAPWPREVLALGAAALLLTSRRMASRNLLGLVDWQLLVLFIALFVVNQALAASGMLETALRALAAAGLDLGEPAPLFAATVLLSNLVSNVPAVMLLLPAAEHPLAGPILALASTLAGNLLIVGSIANIIVLDQAARLGVVIGWREHARIGIPVTILTLALAAVWLWIRSL
jgi:Na+/H+ antiporter NhaD/arsenite permease-like protein